MTERIENNIPGNVTVKVCSTLRRERSCKIVGGCLVQYQTVFPSKTRLHGEQFVMYLRCDVRSRTFCERLSQRK